MNFHAEKAELKSMMSAVDLCFLSAKRFANNTYQDASGVQASGALKRASRGGMLVGSQLLAVASTLTGATRLQRSVMGASRAADGTGDYDLFAVLTHCFKVGASAAVPAAVTVHVTMLTNHVTVTFTVFITINRHLFVFVSHSTNQRAWLPHLL